MGWAQDLGRALLIRVNRGVSPRAETGGDKIGERQYAPAITRRAVSSEAVAVYVQAGEGAWFNRAVDDGGGRAHAASLERPRRLPYACRTEQGWNALTA